MDDEKKLDIFVHYSNILSDGFKELAVGESVSYDIADTDRGKTAVNVTRKG